MSTSATVYLTKEQVQRLAALACDALVGMQLTTDDGDQSDVRVDLVDFDSRSRHFLVGNLGEIEETT